MFGRLTAKGLRKAVRDKLLRAVDEVVHRHRRDQLTEVERLIGRLRTDIAQDTTRQVNRAVDRIVEFEVRSRKDIVFAGDRQAAAESSRFAGEHLVGAKSFRHPWETLGYGVSLAPAGGMALEFGVATGNTLRLIAGKRKGTEVYGFDSFQGLPQAWLPGMSAGAFAQDDLPEVPGAELVVGMFEETLPKFLDAHPGPVDFLHVDCDLYGSARTVLEHVGPRLEPGSVIVFDEFFNYPGWQRHEYRAWLEYVAETGLAFRYEAFTYQDCQVALRLT